MISQRVSTLASCDRIIVLDNGEMAGFAPHKVLYDTCEIYHSICESQHVERGIA